MAGGSGSISVGVGDLPSKVYNPMVPTEGPKIIPIVVDLTVANIALVDLSQQQSQGKISFLQTIYIDNADNAQPAIIQSQMNRVRYVIPAGAEAILPFFVANPPKFTVQTAGAIRLPVYVLNVPINPCVWQAGADGTIIVSDPVLEALISDLGDGPGLATYDLALFPLIEDLGGGPALDVNVVFGGGGSGTTSILIIGGANALMNSAVHFADTPAPNAGEEWFITAMEIMGSFDLSAASAPYTFLVEYLNSNRNLANYSLNLPAAAAVTWAPDQPIARVEFNPPLKGHPTLDINSAIRIGQSSGVALASGQIYMNLWGFSA